MTSPQVKPDADWLGYAETIEHAGGQVLAGMCFYQSYAGQMRARLPDVMTWIKLPGAGRAYAARC